MLFFVPRRRCVVVSFGVKAKKRNCVKWDECALDKGYYFGVT